MLIYDDKTRNVIITKNQLILPYCNTNEDVTFKASYIVSSNLICKGKISALFDLIVFGDLQAEEIEVKGRFICMGNCVVSGAIVVHNDIWCEDIQAGSITCHDRIIAQSIDANTIVAEGNIVTGKTLAIEDKAHTSQNVICGETAYGSGRIEASCILTAEPLDLDDGEEALGTPFQYTPNSTAYSTPEVADSPSNCDTNKDLLDYISNLINSTEGDQKKQLEKFFAVASFLDTTSSLNISELRDSSLIVWLISMSQSNYFKEWEQITEWTDVIAEHFRNLAEGKVCGSKQGKPADKLLKGYVVNHSKYGIGTVVKVYNSGIGKNSNQMAMINFDEYGIKAFPIPNALKFFLVISEDSSSLGDDVKSHITCEINSYEEWLFAMDTIYENRDFLGEKLYRIIFELLIEKIGLKSKFIEDRFKEMGWE